MAMDQYLHPSYCRGLTMMNIHKISRHIMTYHISWNNSSISHMLHGASIFTYKTGSKLGHKNEVNGGIHIPIIPAPWWAHVFLNLSQLKSRCLFPWKSSNPSFPGGWCPKAEEHLERPQLWDFGIAVPWRWVQPRHHPQETSPFWFRMGPPSDVCWFINPMNTIVIYSYIYHKP